MTNEEVAKILRNVAAAYTLLNENHFRTIAYEKASDTIFHSNVEIEDLWKENKLSNLPGIGSTMVSHLDELFRTGHVKHFEQVFSKVPKSIFPLLDVPGFGPKKAYRLVTELKLNSPDSVIDDLFDAAKSGKIAPIEGFGEKSQTVIFEALERFKKGRIKGKRVPLSIASNIALELILYLKQYKDTIEVYTLGSLRRMAPTTGDIDLAAKTNNPEGVLEWLLKYPKRASIVEKGPRGATILLRNGIQVDLRVQSPKSFGAMMQYFTGSKNHNVKLREFALKQGLSLSEYGIKSVNKIQKSKFKSQNYNAKLKIYEYEKENEFYGALGLQWIPPEMREDAGEIEASNNNKLPQLVKLGDIRGDFHIHSNYNLEPSHDLGSSSLEEILSQAEKLKYEYIGISDHNPSRTKHTKNDIITILKRRKLVFEHIMSSTKSVRVNLFTMLETDILPDGRLPLPDEAFDYLDGTIVSIHSSFNMDKRKMTERIISGLSHPKAKILAHPTGRLIGRREGYDVDWEKLFNFCKEKDKAIEINAYPDRLDLPDVLIREAIKKGIKLVIGTDSHQHSQMELMFYGVSQARRGWATKHDIINTKPYNMIRKWLL